MSKFGALNKSSATSVELTVHAGSISPAQEAANAPNQLCQAGSAAVWATGTGGQRCVSSLIEKNTHGGGDEAGGGGDPGAGGGGLLLLVLLFGVDPWGDGAEALGGGGDHQ